MNPLACHVPLRCLGVFGGCLGVSEGYLSGIYGIWRRSDVVGGYVGSQSLQYGAKTLFRHSPVRHNFCHLTILRHWNIKMAAYKLSKNGWVMQFLVIFSLARKKLLVTVAFDHPVALYVQFFISSIDIFYRYHQYIGFTLCFSKETVFPFRRTL